MPKNKEDRKRLTSSYQTRIMLKEKFFNNKEQIQDVESLKQVRKFAELDFKSNNDRRIKNLLMPNRKRAIFCTKSPFVCRMTKTMNEIKQFLISGI